MFDIVYTVHSSIRGGIDDECTHIFYPTDKSRWRFLDMFHRSKIFLFDKVDDVYV